jgi:hypothetical protein
MSLFGQPSTGGFGTPAAGSQPSVFGGAATAAPAFGAPASAPSVPSAFGKPAQPVGGGLFGAPATLTGGFASGFGSTGGTSALGGTAASAAAPASGGIFGGGFRGAAQQSTPATTGFSFGPQQTSGPALAGFGAPAIGSSLFGQQLQPQQQRPQSEALHNEPQAPPGNTRVSQLPNQAIQMLEAAERHITDQRAKAARLFALQPTTDKQISAVRERCAATRRRLVRTDTGVEALASNADALRNAVREDRRWADGVSHSLTQLSRSLEARSGLQSASAYAYGNGDTMTPVPPSVTHVNPEYFASVVNDLEERTIAYKREIDQIAEYLSADGGGGKDAMSSATGLDALHARYQSTSAVGGGSYDGEGYRVRNGRSADSRMGGAPAESRGRAIEDVIRRQYEYFMVVANNVAAVHETLTLMRDDFMAEARRHDADAVDPFAQADARERAEEERKHRAAATVQVGVKDSAGVVNQSGANTTPQVASQTGSAFGGFGGSVGGFGTAGAGVAAPTTPGLALVPLSTSAFGAPTAAATTSAFGGFGGGFGATLSSAPVDTQRRPTTTGRRTPRR